MGIVNAVWTFAVTAVQGLPAYAQVALAGLLLSLVLTQWLKAFLPTQGRWIRLAALLSAFVPCALFARTPAGLLSAAIAGLGSPLVYKLTIMFVRARWPELAVALSADSPSYRLSDWLQGSRPSSSQVGSYLQSLGSR